MAVGNTLISVDLVPTNGKRMVYLDNMSPRGQEQASHALYGACGRFGEPLGASWGLRRASNGLEHGLPARTVKRFGTVSVQVLGVAPRGFPLAERRASPPLIPGAHANASAPSLLRRREGRSEGQARLLGVPTQRAEREQPLQPRRVRHIVAPPLQENPAALLMPLRRPAAAPQRRLAARSRGCAG